MRRSLDYAKKREIFNVVIKDVAQHRLQKDILAVSVTDSMGQTGFGNALGGMGGGGRRRKDDSLRRQTGDQNAFNRTGMSLGSNGG